MSNGKLLGTWRYIKPDFARFLLSTNDTKRSTVELESLFGGYNLNQGCLVAILIKLLCSMSVSRQIGFQQFETHYANAVCHCRQYSHDKECENE